MMAWIRSRNEHADAVQSATDNMRKLLEAAANARNEQILNRDLIAHMIQTLEEIASDEDSPWAKKARAALAWSERERKALEAAIGHPDD